MIDVKNIFDIPDFEKLADKEFHFDCYDISDNLQCYSYESIYKEKNFCTEYQEINVTIISNEKLITYESKLSDLATQEEIQYFEIHFEKGNRYCFRPHVPESEKQYL